jgi:hypothetical protein
VNILVAVHGLAADTHAVFDGVMAAQTGPTFPVTVNV